MLKPDLVQKAFRMVADRELTSEQAERYASLLGSREELLAHLILVENVLDPRLRAHLLAAAKASAVLTQTPRTDHGDLSRRQNADSDVQRALHKIIEADMGSIGSLRELESAKANRFRHAGGPTDAIWAAACDGN